MAASAPPVAPAESAGEGPVAAVVVVVDVDVHVWILRRSQRHGGLGGRGDGRSARWPVKPPADQLERRGVANATDGHRLAGPATPAAVEGAAALAGRARWRGRSRRARHGGRGGWQRRRRGRRTAPHPLSRPGASSNGTTAITTPSAEPETHRLRPFGNRTRCSRQSAPPRACLRPPSVGARVRGGTAERHTKCMKCMQSVCRSSRDSPAQRSDGRMPTCGHPAIASNATIRRATR